MNLLAPLARPVFEWNHDWVMARGGEGIAQLLGCRLLGERLSADRYLYGVGTLTLRVPSARKPQIWLSERDFRLYTSNTDR